MTESRFETLVGFLVIGVALFLGSFAYTHYNKPSFKGLDLIARFERADGLSIGTDVRISGIRVGSVAGMRLDPETYVAIVTLSVDPGLKIPVDSSASIMSDGLFGGRYVALAPGADAKNMEAGSRFKHTQSAVNLESLISKVMVGK